jgi:predicted transcriptional regulator
MMAKQLMAKHGLNQEQAAKLLGVSQPAISLYSRRMRGKAIDIGRDAEITKLVESLATSLAESGMSHKEFIPRFCEICRTIRAKGLLCQMHKTFDSTINIEECELCMFIDSLRCP